MALDLLDIVIKNCHTSCNVSKLELSPDQSDDAGSDVVDTLAAPQQDPVMVSGTDGLD